MARDKKDMIDSRELRLGNLFIEQKTRNILKVIELSETKVVFSGLRQRTTIQ